MNWLRSFCQKRLIVDFHVCWRTGKLKIWNAPNRHLIKLTSYFVESGPQELTKCSQIMVAGKSMKQWLGESNHATHVVSLTIPTANQIVSSPRSTRKLCGQKWWIQQSNDQNIQPTLATCFNHFLDVIVFTMVGQNWTQEIPTCAFFWLCWKKHRKTHNIFPALKQPFGLWRNPCQDSISPVKTDKAHEAEPPAKAP